MPRNCQRNKFASENFVCQSAQNALSYARASCGRGCLAAVAFARADDLGRPASPMPATAVAYKMRNRCFLLAVVMLLCGFVLAGAAIAAEPSPPPEKAEHEAL